MSILSFSKKEVKKSAMDKKRMPWANKASKMPMVGEDG